MRAINQYKLLSERRRQQEQQQQQQDTVYTLPEPCRITHDKRVTLHEGPVVAPSTEVLLGTAHDILYVCRGNHIAAYNVSSALSLSSQSSSPPSPSPSEHDSNEVPRQIKLHMDAMDYIVAGNLLVLNDGEKTTTYDWCRDMVVRKGTVFWSRYNLCGDAEGCFYQFHRTGGYGFNTHQTHVSNTFSYRDLDNDTECSTFYDHFPEYTRMPDMDPYDGRSYRILLHDRSTMLILDACSPLDRAARVVKGGAKNSERWQRSVAKPFSSSSMSSSLIDPAPRHAQVVFWHLATATEHRYIHEGMLPSHNAFLRDVAVCVPDECDKFFCVVAETELRDCLYVLSVADGRIIWEKTAYKAHRMKLCSHDNEVTLVQYEYVELTGNWELRTILHRLRNNV